GPGGLMVRNMKSSAATVANGLLLLIGLMVMLNAKHAAITTRLNARTAVSRLTTFLGATA
ncbi:hypothetical protein, partial [Staphylococcus aureus]